MCLSPCSVDVGDVVYHVINRSNGRVPIFKTGAEYIDFLYLLNEMRETYGMCILAVCIMPNHMGNGAKHVKSAKIVS